jgi:hypothetical protein
MPVDPTKYANLLAAAAAGIVIPSCEYLQVDWDGSHTNYYAAAAWNETTPFLGIGKVLEPRIILNRKDPFHELELCPDLRSDTVNITFDDIGQSPTPGVPDRGITTKFQTYGSGVNCSFHIYFPSVDGYDIDLDIGIWSGQLQAPQIWQWGKVKATATNGNRSRELLSPSRNFRQECTAAIFAGKLPNTDAVRSSLCIYDRHLGGSVGLLNAGSPFTDCPKDPAACVARLDLNSDGVPEYYGGFNTNAISTIVPGHSGSYIAVSHGNQSALPNPLRVIFGKKNVRENLLLAFRPEDNAGDHAHGFVATLWAICEGPVSEIANISVNGNIIEQMHLNFRLGTRGQPRTAYGTDISNFSGTAHVFARYGWVDARTITASNLTSEAYVTGFSEVCVYTDATTKTRIYSANRVWCLLELYRNQKFGLGYAEGEFTIGDFIDVADWTEDWVAFTKTYGDGETLPFVTQRSTFNAILEGKQVAEQIEDICRSGGISVPFQYESAFTIAKFGVATVPELAAARVFTDSGQDVNILWDGNQPMIELSQTPENKVVNEIEMRFEEAAKGGTERPVVIAEDDQKLKAGRQLGQDYFLAVPKRYNAFGVDNVAETVKLGYRIGKFGEFDSGGWDNNLKVTITVPYVYAVDLKRYEIIKIVSDLLDGFTIGLHVADQETPQYFRVLTIKKVAGGRCQITAQAYNHTAYTAFEVASVLPPGPTFIVCITAGTAAVRGSYWFPGNVNDRPGFYNGSVRVEWSGTQWEVTQGTTLLYYSTDDVATPILVTTWVAVDGELPLPVFVPTIVNPPGCELTIGDPVYDAITKKLSIPIEPC